MEVTATHTSPDSKFRQKRPAPILAYSDPKTAQRMMSVASKFGNLPNIDIAPSALYLLASDSKIAEHVGCSQGLVSQLKQKLHLISPNKIPDRSTAEVTRNGTTYEMNTANIGCSRQYVNEVCGHLVNVDKIDRSAVTVTRAKATSAK